MNDASGAADRELRAEAVVAAPPDRVWTLLSDVSHMGGVEPRAGADDPAEAWWAAERPVVPRDQPAQAVVWPTRSVVAVVEPRRTVAWDVQTSGARWIWELRPEGEGTRVLHRRPVPERLTRGETVFARMFLGGEAGTPTSSRRGWRRRWPG